MRVEGSAQLVHCGSRSLWRCLIREEFPMNNLGSLLITLLIPASFVLGGCGAGDQSTCTLRAPSEQMVRSIMVVGQGEASGKPDIARGGSIGADGSGGNGSNDGQDEADSRGPQENGHCRKGYQNGELFDFAQVT